MDDPIIQIMPAKGDLFVNTTDDCGNNIKTPVLCIALTKLGLIQFVYLDSDGRAKKAWEASGYKGW